MENQGDFDMPTILNVLNNGKLRSLESFYTPWMGRDFEYPLHLDLASPSHWATGCHCYEEVLLQSVPSIGQTGKRLNTVTESMESMLSASAFHLGSSTVTAGYITRFSLALSFPVFDPYQTNGRCFNPRIFQHTPGTYPRPSTNSLCRDSFHLGVWGCLGYAPGLCRGSLRFKTCTVFI